MVLSIYFSYLLARWGGVCLFTMIVMVVDGRWFYLLGEEVLGMVVCKVRGGFVLLVGYVLRECSFLFFAFLVCMEW